MINIYVHLFGVGYVSTKRKISILGILERFYKYCNGKAVAELTKRRLHL